MTLADLRKLSIRKKYRIHFRLRNAMECVISDHGVAQVPALQKAPDFNLEEELAAAGEFLLEPAFVTDRKNPEKPRTLGREEMLAMAAGGPASAPAHDEHEDD